MNLREMLAKAKEHATGQAKKTKEAVVEGAKKAADAVVIDDESLPSKRLAKIAESMQNKPAVETKGQ